MPSWSDLANFLKWLIKEAPSKIDRRLLVAALVGASLIAVPEMILLNPKFGSANLKVALIRGMVGNADEYRTIVRRLAKPRNKQVSEFEKGAAQAGFFTTHDANFIRDWENEAEKLSWSRPIADNPALQDARARAEESQPPFQPVGAVATVTSPDCRIDRPDTGVVFMNAGRHLTRVFKPEEIVKIANAAGGGLPVIARIEFPHRKMPGNTDLYLNKFQMEKMLGQLGSSAKVMVSIASGLPNQSDDDDELDRTRRCRRPDVR